MLKRLKFILNGWENSSKVFSQKCHDQMHFGKVTLLSENNGFEEIQKQRGGEIEGFMIQTI